MFLLVSSLFWQTGSCSALLEELPSVLDLYCSQFSLGPILSYLDVLTLQTFVWFPILWGSKSIFPCKLKIRWKNGFKTIVRVQETFLCFAHSLYFPLWQLFTPSLTYSVLEDCQIEKFRIPFPRFSRHRLSVFSSLPPCNHGCPPGPCLIASMAGIKKPRHPLLKYAQENILSIWSSFPR